METVCWLMSECNVRSKGKACGQSLVAKNKVGWKTAFSDERSASSLGPVQL